MVEDDTFTYQANRQPAEPTTAGSASTLDYALITKERTQKLDLLIHLLANLPHSLVVCGPEGIGKTTLLTVLQERRTEAWQYCLIQGGANLSFEAIQRHLAQAISREQAPLAITFARYQEQHKQLILIIDNAAELVPGLITAVIQYAIANPALKIIFALTHDELQVKRGTDRAVDDCHIIEIPTLSEKQCGDFLQHLSLKPAANLTFKAINDNMIAHIYRETHGVPGRIIAAVSGLSSAKKSGGKLTGALLLALAAAIAVAIAIQWPLLPEDNKAVIADEHKVAAIETAPEPFPIQPAIEEPVQAVQEEAEAQVEANSLKDAPPTLVSEETILLESSVASDPVITDAAELPEKLEQPTLIEPNELIRQPASTEQPTLTGQAETKKPKTKTKPEPVTEAEHKPDNNTQAKTAEQLWAAQEKLKQAKQEKTLKPDPLKPSANHFTLQLIVLSKQASVNTILKKYPAMEPDIKTIKTRINGQDRFILYYGAYPDAASADRAKQSLPFEFRNALVKKE